MVNKMKRLTFYLVGPIQYVEDYMSWRQDVADFLDSLGHSAEFPWGEVYHGKEMKGQFSEWIPHMSRDEWIHKVRRYMRAQVIRYDLNALLRSDGLIFYLPKGAVTVGSYGEQTVAYYLKKWTNQPKYKGKRIFVIIEDDDLMSMSYWLIGCSDVLFFSMKEFKRYFKQNFNRIKKKRAKK